METLFEPPDDHRSGATTEVPDGDLPLAARMRPRTLEQFIGQRHLLDDGAGLRVAVEAGRLHSAVFHGPPGTGKTTLARLAAERAEGAFEELSAVQAGRAEVRGVLERAAQRRQSGRRTVFFLDEIHRFNKAQQDALLPAVEEGLVVLMGATTENPYFEVNSALLSRCQVYELRALDAGDTAEVLRRALDDERGVPDAPPLSDEAIAHLARQAGGDARAALAALERAVALARDGGLPEIDLAVAEDALQRQAVRYDRAGDQHYDFASALIKSLRGSDPDAALYYLAVMLEGGEDPKFIARRLIILASEDIGLADPQALPLAVAAARAVEQIGLPEGRITLGHAVVALAMAPKSNAAYRGISQALDEVRENGAHLPPNHLRDGHYAGASKLGRGVGYRYPHDAPGGVNDQRHLPDDVTGPFYEPTAHGAEARAAERLSALRRTRTGGAA